MTSFPKLTAAKGIAKPEWKYASDTAIENEVLSVSSISLNDGLVCQFTHSSIVRVHQLPSTVQFHHLQLTHVLNTVRSMLLHNLCNAKLLS
jgi:hypothetical protein